MKAGREGPTGKRVKENPALDAARVAGAGPVNERSSSVFACCFLSMVWVPEATERPGTRKKDVGDGCREPQQTTLKQYTALGL